MAPVYHDRFAEPSNLQSLRGAISYHADFTIDTGVQVYFCDPHSSWQRGSNENTNGLLRQYFPHGTDFSLVDEARLKEVEVSLNRRPR